MFVVKYLIAFPTYEQNEELEELQTALLADSANVCGGVLNTSHKRSHTYGRVNYTTQL
jgi:hypothetical protein